MSVSAGLLGNKEYKLFCKWGKHLNIDLKKTAIKNYLAQRLLTIWYHQEPITQHTLNDKEVQKIFLLLVRTEQILDKFCQQDWNPRLEQSQRSLETLRRYIDTESSHIYTSDDIEKLLKQAQHQLINLISDTAQLGKSTILTYLSNQIKQKFTARWVVRIDLNDNIEVLKALRENRSIRRKRLNFCRGKCWSINLIWGWKYLNSFVNKSRR